jgi:hypothetical protein
MSAGWGGLRNSDDSDCGACLTPLAAAEEPGEGLASWLRRRTAELLAAAAEAGAATAAAAADGGGVDDAMSVTGAGVLVAAAVAVAEDAGIAALRELRVLGAAAEAIDDRAPPLLPLAPAAAPGWMGAPMVAGLLARAMPAAAAFAAATPPPPMPMPKPPGTSTGSRPCSSARTAATTMLDAVAWGMPRYRRHASVFSSA